MIGIYKVVNLINNKVYIGQSTKIEYRWSQHRRKPFCSSSSQYDTYFYRAIRKYGIDNFLFEVVEECEPNLLNILEQKWILYYRSNENEFGYNSTLGGDNNHPLVYSQVLEIKQLLKTTKLSQQEIAEKYNISQRMVSAINIGESWIEANLSYPLRTESIQKGISSFSNEVHVCIDCGKSITGTATRCIDCAHIQQRVVERPSREVLKDEIRNNSFLSLSKKYKVSDNAIRKWCKSYGLPQKSSEIKQYSKEQWDLI